MTGCTLKIVDPTLKYYLGRDKFDSYEDFKNSFEDKFLEGLVPINNEIKPISRGVNGYVLGDVTFDRFETLLNQLLSGLLDTNDPNLQFSKFVQTAEVYSSKYNSNSPEILTDEIEDQDLDFLKSTLNFFENYPVSQDLRSSSIYDEFKQKTKQVKDIIDQLENRDVEPEIRVDESHAWEEQLDIFPYIYSVTHFYDSDSTNPDVFQASDPLAIIRHKVGKKIEQLLDKTNLDGKDGKKFFMRLEPDNESNVQSVKTSEIPQYGVVGVLYELVGNDYKRVYVSSNDNNPEGEIELTTNEANAISLDINGSKNLTFTMPDMRNISYIARDNPVNADVVNELIRIRQFALTQPSLFYPVQQIRNELPVSPKAFKRKRLISLRAFLQGNTNTRLEIATENDRVVYAGNLFVRFPNQNKAALNRTPLNDEWKQRVLDLVNHEYGVGEIEEVVTNLNKLLEYKGGDIQFFSRGNKILTYRKSIKIGSKIIRLEKMQEVKSEELKGLLDYAKINVDKQFLQDDVTNFPIIKDGKLKTTEVNFGEFYKDHHTTIARQVKVNDKLYFPSIKSILFDVKSPEGQKLEEVAKKLENPKIGNIEIEQDKDVDLTEIVRNLVSIANETIGSTKDILILLNALLDNEEVKEKLKGGIVNFSTKYDKDFVGISNGKEIEINWNLLPNTNMLGEVLAHEIIHTLTRDWINANQDSPVVQRLNGLLDLVPNTIPEYNKANIYELLASISNPEIAEQLRKVKVEDKNLLEQIIDVVKQILNKVFGLDNLEPNLYNELINKLIVISTSKPKAEVKEKPKNKFGLKRRDTDSLPLGYSEQDVEKFLNQRQSDKSFLNSLVKSIDADLANYIHNKGLLQDFLAGRLDFLTVFRNLFNDYEAETNLREDFSPSEEKFFQALADDPDFIEDYWIKNTNFASVRKPKKGEVSNQTEELNEVETDKLKEEGAKVDNEKLDTDQLIDEGANEEKIGVERGTDKSTLELADPMSRAFVKMLPKIERINGVPKIYTEEEYNKSNEKTHFVKVPNGYIKFSKNELGRLELCDYTPTWNLIALALSNSLSLEDMVNRIESNPKLIDTIPEIYVFKDRVGIDQPINNDFKSLLRAALETAFKKAKVGINVIIKDANGNYLVRDESADFTQKAKQKINFDFLNNIQDDSLNKYFNQENAKFNIKQFLLDRNLIDNKSQKNIPNVEKNDAFVRELGFVFNPKTIREEGSDFYRKEYLDFKINLVSFLSNFDTVSIKIADFITEDQGKVQGLNNFFKNLYRIENDINPLVSTTMVKNAEGENQSVLSIYNSILQDREHYNNSQSIEELQSKIDRTRNDLFNYSLTKRLLFNEEGKRTKNKIQVDILSGLKTMQEGSATKGQLTIDLEDADWLKLNFVGMLKAGMIENTRAETASTSYAFRATNWNPGIYLGQVTPFTIIQTKNVWNVKDKKIELDTNSPVYRVWSDYLKGELSRISKIGLKRDKDGKVIEQFGLYADILNSDEKDVLLRDLLEFNKDVDQIINDSTSLIINSLNRFFNNELEEYNHLFENVMGGYSSIIGNLEGGTGTDLPQGDQEIYNLLYKEAGGKNNKEEYKAFFVLNSLTIHTEETVLFQGDLTESPKYFKRAKGVQSTGTPLSTSPQLTNWVNQTLNEFSFGSILGVTPQIGDTFNSATIKDDVKESVYYKNGQLQQGYRDSKKAYNEAQGITQSDEEIEKEVNLLKPYGETNIGDGDGGINPDFWLTLLRRVGNVSQEQIIGYKALVLDAKKNAKFYGLGKNQQLTPDEEKLMQEGLHLIEEGKAVFPKLKVTYRGNALTQDTVSKEIMDKFALFPLFPQFTYDKPAAHHLLKQLLKENKAYVKFESGTKIQNLGKTNFLEEVEKGNFDITLEDSQHTLMTEKLREQIKTPNKVKEKNTFGSQFRKLIESGLRIGGKYIKLSSEGLAGETVRRWEKLNQEFSSLTKQDILKEFGITSETQSGKLDYSNVKLAKVATLLAREAERKDLPENIQVYFDKFKQGQLTSQELENYYKYLEASFGNQQMQALLASIIKKISVQKLSGAQLIQVSQSLYDRKIKQGNKTRDLGFYHFKDGKVQAAECKVSLIGDFKNLLNLQEVKGKLKDRENPNILERTRALNELLQDDNFVEKHKDKLTIVSYRIPTQGFNSMEVMVIREFLPTFHGPTIVCPPEITTQSGTDYDYDKMSVIFPSIDSEGNLSTKGAKHIQNQMIQTSGQILLDPVNYHRLITPNTNAIIFDFLKGTKDKPGLLSRLGKSTKEPKNTEVITFLVNLAKFRAVKGKGLLGIAAVWNTFTTLIQRHDWKLNNVYTKVIGFGKNQQVIDVKVNPVLLENKPTILDTNKPDTENGVSKQEIVSQLINVTVDMPSDDTFGQTVFNKSDFGALIYAISMLGYSFEKSMLFFHQPVIYEFKQMVQAAKQKGASDRVAKFEAISKLLDIEIPVNKFGTPKWVEFEVEIFKQLDILESQLDTSKLDGDITSLDQIDKVKIDAQQKAVLAHYLKLLDQANEVRVVQSAINFDTRPDNSLYKVEERSTNYDNAIKANFIDKSYINEIMSDSVISGLYISPILSNLGQKVFPILYTPENSKMFSDLSSQYMGKEEQAYRKATNDFLHSIVQNFGTFNGESLFNKANQFLRSGKKLELIKQATNLKKKLNKEGVQYRLLNSLVSNISTKRPDTVYNLQIFMGLENSSEDKEKITEEWRKMLNSNDNDTKEFAQNLAIVGIIQSGWAKSPLYFSDLIPEEFTTPIINQALEQYDNLTDYQKKLYRDTFKINFDNLEGGTLGRTDGDPMNPNAKFYQKDPYRLMDYRIEVNKVFDAKELKQKSEFIVKRSKQEDNLEEDFEVSEKEGLFYELNNTQDLHPKDRFKHDGNLQTTLSKLLNIKERNSNNDYYLQTINALINITNRLIQIESESTQPQSDIFLDYVDQLTQDKTYFSYEETNKIKEIISKAVEKLPVRYFATSHGNYQIHRSDNQDQILANSISLNEMFTVSDKPYVLEVHKMDAGSKYHTSLKRSLLVIPKLRAVIDHSFSSHAKGLDIVFGSKLKNINTFSRYEPDFDNIESVSIPVDSVLDVDFTTVIEAPVDQLDPLNIGPLRGEQYDRRILIRDAKEKNLSTQDIENIQKELDEIDAEIKKRIKLEQQGEDFKSTLNKVEYQYYGAKYNILVDNNNKGIDVEGYAGKSKNKQKLLDAYNTNPNVDPQNGQVWRQESTTVPSNMTRTDIPKSESYKFKDGFEVRLKFKLNEEQQNALSRLEQFVKSKETTITLSGAAGTGKSTLVSIFNEWLEKKNFIYPKYSAPTHRANAVTKLMNPKVSVYTLHSLFGLSPDLDLESGNFDVKQLKFAQQNKIKIERNDVLIIDESSMISDALYEFIQQFQQEMNLRVVYVGDQAQLKPVKQKDKSKVFTSSEHDVVSLTKVERTGDNAVLEEATNIRNGKDWNYQTKIKNNQGVIYITDRPEFLKVAKENFETQDKLDNKLYFRILAATNKSVTDVNEAVRKVLYPNSFQDQLVVGDIIMGYDNFDYDYNSGQYKLYNGGDYQVTSVTPASKTVEEIEETFKGYQVTLNNILDKDSKPYQVFVIDNSEDERKSWKLANYIQSLQIEGAKMLKVDPRSAAGMFSKANFMKKQVAFMKDIDKMDTGDSKSKTVIRKTFDYGYAHTIHKSQGGTYDRAMILADTIAAPFDSTTQQELKYVAVSRARNIAYVRTSHAIKESEPKSTTEQVNQPKSDKQLVNEYLTKVTTGKITPDWFRLKTSVNFDRIRENESIPILVESIKKRIEEFSQKLEQYEREGANQDIIENVNNQIQGYGSLIYDLLNLRNEPLGYNQKSVEQYKQKQEEEQQQRKICINV